VLKGRLDLPGFLDNPIIREAWSLAEWHGPSQGQIDPLKEALASRLKIDQNLSTLDREATEINGSDWQQNMRQRAQEVKLRSSLGLDEAELLDQAAQPNTKSSLTNDVLMRIALNLLHEEQAA